MYRSSTGYHHLLQMRAMTSVSEAQLAQYLAIHGMLSKDDADDARTTACADLAAADIPSPRSLRDDR